MAPVSNHPEAIRSRRRRAGVSAIHSGEDEGKVRRLEAAVRELQVKFRREQKRADDAEDLRSAVFGLTAADFTTSPIWPKHVAGNGSSLHVPVLFTSDFQFGEVVKLDEMDGMNEFNADVFAERYARMIDKTIRWCDGIQNGWKATYPGCYYLRGGDAISGEIHAELSETNDFGAIPAIAELVRHERGGILRLKARFGAVHVISIPGNHGRTTLKPRHKSYVAANFETILAWALQWSLASESGVTFDTPASGYARFKVGDWWFEMRHGDRMGAGGGTGWIGAPAPITKGHKKIRVDAAAVGAPVDYVLTGHLHTSMQLPHGWANGCMPGYNEFARSFGLEPDCAKQWLIMVPEGHMPYGIELHLSDPPRRQT